MWVSALGWRAWTTTHLFHIACWHSPFFRHFLSGWHSPFVRHFLFARTSINTHTSIKEHARRQQASPQGCLNPLVVLNTQPTRAANQDRGGSVTRGECVIRVQRAFLQNDYTLIMYVPQKSCFASSFTQTARHTQVSAGVSDVWAF